MVLSLAMCTSHLKCFINVVNNTIHKQNDVSSSYTEIKRDPIEIAIKLLNIECDLAKQHRLSRDRLAGWPLTL